MAGYKSIAICLAAFCHGAFAREDDNPMSFSGFVGYGLSLQSGNKELNSQGDIAEAGIKGNAIISDSLETNVQGLYRKVDLTGERSDWFIDYATLDWQFNATSWGEQTFSIGRFKSNGGIYSNTRDVPFTRPSILLARSVYQESLRSFYQHTDGIRFSSFNSFNTNTLEFEVGFGDSDISQSFFSIFPDDEAINANEGSGTSSAKGSWFIDVRYRPENWIFAFSYNRSSPKTSGTFIDVETGELPFSLTFHFDSYILGAQYFAGDWEFTGEFVRQNVETVLDGRIQPAFSFDGYYLQTRHYLNAEWSIMVRYEKLNLAERTSLLTDNEEGPQLANDSSILALGASWNIAPDWQFAAEVHQVNEKADDTLHYLLQLVWRW